MSEKISGKNERIFSDEIVYETDYFSVCQDWEIAIPGFYIVSPKRKMKTILDFTKEESIDFMEILIKVRGAMSEVLGIEDVYYFQNEDTSYGFHFWILPYYDWMSRVSTRGPGLLLSVWKYAKENMLSDEDISRTREAAEKIRNFLNK